MPAGIGNQSSSETADTVLFESFCQPLAGDIQQNSVLSFRGTLIGTLALRGPRQAHVHTHLELHWNPTKKCPANYTHPAPPPPPITHSLEAPLELHIADQVHTRDGALSCIGLHLRQLLLLPHIQHIPAAAESV